MAEPSMQIMVKIRSGIWQNEKEEAIVKRIARVVLDDDSQVYEEREDYAWHLGKNSWWTTAVSHPKRDREGVYKEITVAYRYGYAHFKVMQGLETLLNFIFS